MVRNRPSLALLLPLALAASCASPRPRPYEPDSVASRLRHDERTPDWAGQEPTWDKLRRIETWLDGEGLRASDYWRIEAELERAEGRVVLAQAESRATEMYASRLRASEQAFDRVFRNTAANGPQRERARRGLERLRASGPVAEAPSALVDLGTMGIIGRESWRARRAVPAKMTPSGGDYSRITIHHSADVVTAHLDGSAQRSMEALRKIQVAHMEGANTGWGDVGYHFLIDPAGRVFEGRQLTWQGAHSSKENNVANIGICVLGNFDTSRPTPAALASLESLVETLRARFDIPRNAMHGHYEFKSTACPGKHLREWLAGYKAGGRGAPLAARR